MKRWTWALVAALLLASGWMLQRSPSGVIPELPAPPPLPASALEPLAAPATLTLRDVRFMTSLEARVQVPLIEIISDVPNLGETVSQLHVESIRVVGMRVVAPIDTIITPLDPFTVIPGPRLRVDRVSLVDADVGELAHPEHGYGRWFFRLRDLDLELRDVDIAGQRSVPEQLRIARLDFAGESKGEPFQVTRLVAAIERTPQRFDLQTAAGFGLTDVKVNSSFTPAHDFAIDLVADTIRFGELQVLDYPIPRYGDGKLSVKATRSGDVFNALIRNATAQIGSGRLAARGQLDTGDHGELSNLLVEVNNLESADLKGAFGLSLPVAGPYTGQVSANGRFSQGVRVAGLIHGNAAGETSRLTLNGTVRTDPHAFIDLHISGDPLRMADTVFTLFVRARGPLDTLGIQGSLAMRPTTLLGVPITLGVQPAPPERAVAASATLDAILLDPPGSAPRRLNGRAVLHGAASADQNGGAQVQAHALAEGSIVFGERPTVDARITTDSLPLDFLPRPDGIESVRGSANGGIRITGALRDPSMTGSLQLRNAGLRIESANLEIDRINGPLRIEDDRVMVDGVSGRVRNGTITANGAAVVLGENKRVDLGIRLDRAHLPTRTRLYTASGEVRLVGPLDKPSAMGQLSVLDVLAQRIAGTASGRAVLDRAGALQIVVAADSLPVESLPVSTSQVDSLGGYLRGRIALTGTIEAPSIDGKARLFEARGRIGPYGTRLAGVSGEVRIEDGIARTDGIRGRAGDGTVALSGSAALRGERAINLELRADSALLANTDSAHVIASAEVKVGGTLSRPLVNGRVRVVGGWLKEDLMKPNPVVDPEDPPYADLAARAPWIKRSRLRPDPAEKGDELPFRGRLTVEVTPGIKMIDEDSELRGTGQIVIENDTGKIELSGGVRFLNGYYANFGERFLVSGGGLNLGRLDEPRIALRADHDLDRLGGTNFGAASPLEWYPGLEIFTLGSLSTATEELRRLTPLRESQPELGATLIYRQPFEPIVGWDNPRFWLIDEPSDVVDPRAAQQGSSLFWAYVADEAYDYIPLSRASLHVSTVTIGSRFPGRIVQGPLWLASINLTRRFDVRASLAHAGTALPGLRARWRAGRLTAMAFTEPKFFAVPPNGDINTGYVHRRRTGLGLRWERDY